MKNIFNKTFVMIMATTTTLFGLLYFVTFAEGITYNLLAPFGDTKTVSTFSDYLGSAIPFILRMAAVFAVVQIVVGGFQYAVSETMGGVQDARDRITQAIIGLVLALMSYLILNTISPNLVQLNIGIKPISQIEGINLGGESDIGQHGECRPDPDSGVSKCVVVPGVGPNNCSACGGPSGQADTTKGYCVKNGNCVPNLRKDLCEINGGTYSADKPASFVDCK